MKYIFLLCIVMIFIIIKIKYDRTLKIYNQLYNSGIGLIIDEKYYAAVNVFQNAIELRPSDYRAYEQKGQAWYMLGEYAQSIEDLTKAITLNKKNDLLLIKRGKVYLKINDFENAKKDFEGIIKVKPDHVSAHYNLALAYYQMENYEGAIEALTKAVELDGNNEMNYSMRGNAYLKQKMYSEAIEDYTKAIEINNEENSKLYNPRGIAYLKLTDYDKAIKDFSKLISADPSDIVAYANLGLAYLKAERYNEAIDTLNKAMEIDPNMGVVHKYYADTLRKKGDIELAEKAILKAIELNIEDGNMYLILAEINLAKQNYEDFYSGLESAIFRGVIIDKEFEDHIYDSVRYDERFINLIGKIQE